MARAKRPDFVDLNVRIESLQAALKKAEAERDQNWLHGNETEQALSAANATRIAAEKAQAELSRQVEDFKADNARLASVVSRETSLRLKAETDMRAAVEEKHKVVAQMADLKERLHGAEIENARINGYLDRVHDQDVAREGPVEIGTRTEKIVAPRAPAPLRGSAQPQAMQGGAPSYFADRGGQRHWTSYGDL